MRGHPRDVKKSRVHNWSWPLMGKKSTEFAWELRKPGVFEGVRKKSVSRAFTVHQRDNAPCQSAMTLAKLMSCDNMPL